MFYIKAAAISIGLISQIYLKNRIIDYAILGYVCGIIYYAWTNCDGTNHEKLNK